MDNATLFSLVDTERACAKAELTYNAIRRLLASALPSGAEMHHVGATAIPGCLTKGDLDIVVRVPAQSFADADLMLASKFNRNEDSVRTETFSAFEDTSCDPQLGIQLTAIDGPFDFFHRFVHALTSSPQLVKEYNALKRAHNGRDASQYRAAKAQFFERVLTAHR